MPAKPKPAGDIVRLKVTLRGSKPPIWRRLLVPAATRLDRFHYVLLVAFGWDGGHLHAFEIGGQQYGDPSMLDEADNESRLSLAAIHRAGVKRFTYTYDFGDDWDHTILIEGIEKPVPGQLYPACTAGKRSGPPEDCGGIYGYGHALAVLADPSHPDHAEQVEFMGEDFDPEEFSAAELTLALSAAFGSSPGV